MIIRDAVYDDIDNIAKLYISNWKETYKGLLSEDYLNGLTKEYEFVGYIDDSIDNLISMISLNQKVYNGIYDLLVTLIFNNEQLMWEG